MAIPTEEVTLYLQQLEDGDESAAERLLPHVYEDLRRMAAGMFKDQWRKNHTLQPTALVHEAYMRLVKPQDRGYENRRHFLQVAGLAMRQLLTDYARGRSAQKRGGDRNLVALDAVGDVPADEDTVHGVDLVELERALTKLRGLNSRQADVVEMRFLAGLSMREVAEAMDMPERTAYLDWSMAKSWLQRELGAA
jgi:RNA polymerase sigma factor (TIGR02999 family)